LSQLAKQIVTTKTTIFSIQTQIITTRKLRPTYLPTTDDRPTTDRPTTDRPTTDRPTTDLR